MVLNSLIVYSTILALAEIDMHIYCRDLKGNLTCIVI